MWKATLDACALYSALSRDLLLYFASAKMFTPFWNAEIHSEWVSSLATRRKELNKDDLRKISEKMDEDFPAAKISGLSKLIKGLTLPDVKDRHVLAAAIISESDVIVTWNLKDFPKTYLKRFGITTITPDEFLFRLIGGRAGKLEMFVEELASLSDPPVTPAELLKRMEKSKLQKTADKLKLMLKDAGIEIGDQLKEDKAEAGTYQPGGAKQTGEILYPCEPTVRQFWNFETANSLPDLRRGVAGIG
jgi:predicted nucleic acid-binding protein